MWLQQVLFWLHCLWFSLCRSVRQLVNPPSPRFKNTHRQLVICGDGLAAGLGDYVTLNGEGGGLLKRISKLIRQKKLKARHSWNVIELGGHAVTTDSLIGKMANEKPDVAILVAGIADYKKGIDMYSYIDNMERVVRQLKAKNQCDQVIVSTLPVCWEIDATEYGMQQVQLQSRNEILHKKLLELKCEGLVNHIIRLDLPASGRRENFSYDTLHLNSRGYTKFLEISLSSIQNAILAAEWRVNKEMLGAS